MPEDYPAQGAKQKTNAKGGEGGKGTHRRTYLREELAIKDQRGGDAIQQKIIPVDDGASEATEGRPAGAIKRRCLLVGASGGEGGIHSYPV
jgi:hypothetical protein